MPAASRDHRQIDVEQRAADFQQRQQAEPHGDAASCRPGPPTPSRSGATNRGTCGATNMMMNANGNCSSPDSSGEYPSTNCRYWASRKNVPNMAKNISVIPADATLNRRSLEQVAGRASGGGVPTRATGRTGDGDGGDGERAERGRRRPAVLRALDDPVDERRQADDRQQARRGRRSDARPDPSSGGTQDRAPRPRR